MFISPQKKPLADLSWHYGQLTNSNSFTLKVFTSSICCKITFWGVLANFCPWFLQTMTSNGLQWLIICYTCKDKEHEARRCDLKDEILKVTIS